MTDDCAGRAHADWRICDPQAANWAIVGFAHARDSGMPVPAGLQDALVKCGMCRRWCSLHRALDRVGEDAHAPLCLLCTTAVWAGDDVGTSVNAVVGGRGRLKFVIPSGDGNRSDANRSDAFHMQQSRSRETWCGCPSEHVFDGTCECKYSTEVVTADEAAAQARSHASNVHREVASDEEASEDVWGLGAFLASEGLGF